MSDPKLLMAAHLNMARWQGAVQGLVSNIPDIAMNTRLLLLVTLLLLALTLVVARLDMDRDTDGDGLRWAQSVTLLPPI